MALTREIPRERWKNDLAAFSERNVGRPVRVEVAVSPGEGEPVLAEHQPLVGIDFDPKGSEAPAIEIAVAMGRGGGTQNLTHIIHNPTQVWVDQEADGVGVALKIDSREDGATTILFEREPELPEQATGR
jgi:hypothetical protein